MAISKAMKQRICKLARDSITCVNIQRDYFPNLTWWEIRCVLEEAGTSSSQGLIQEISGKLKKARQTVSKNKELSDALLRINELASQLYYRGKGDLDRLNRIRKAVEG